MMRLLLALLMTLAWGGAVQAADAPPPPPSPRSLRNAPLSTQAQREAWAANMRRLFSPPEMIDPRTGAINQEYFRPVRRQGGAALVAAAAAAGPSSTATAAAVQEPVQGG